LLVQIAKKTIEDLSKEYGEKGDWGAAVGALSSSLGG
jgi:hypothetical protein